LNVASACNLVVVVGRRSWSVVVVSGCGRRSLSSVVVVVGLQLLLSVMIVTAIITLPVVSTAPSMAKGHTSIESAGGAEKAHTARPEALEPRA